MSFKLATSKWLDYLFCPILDKFSGHNFLKGRVGGQFD